MQVNFRRSGTHESEFYQFSKGRLDTHYMHLWLQERAQNLFESLVGIIAECASFKTSIGRPTDEAKENY